MCYHDSKYFFRIIFWIRVTKNLLSLLLNGKTTMILSLSTQILTWLKWLEVVYDQFDLLSSVVWVWGSVAFAICWWCTRRSSWTPRISAGPSACCRCRPREAVPIAAAPRPRVCRPRVAVPVRDSCHWCRRVPGGWPVRAAGACRPCSSVPPLLRRLHRLYERPPYPSRHALTGASAGSPLSSGLRNLREPK